MSITGPYPTACSVKVYEVIYRGHKWLCESRFFESFHGSPITLESVLDLLAVHYGMYGNEVTDHVEAATQAVMCKRCKVAKS